MMEKDTVEEIRENIRSNKDKYRAMGAVGNRQRDDEDTGDVADRYGDETASPRTSRYFDVWDETPDSDPDGTVPVIATLPDGRRFGLWLETKPTLGVPLTIEGTTYLVMTLQRDVQRREYHVKVKERHP